MIQWLYHSGGCAALPKYPESELSNLPRWSSHEAMVLDERCDCGLRGYVLGKRTTGLNSTATPTTYMAEAGSAE